MAFSLFILSIALMGAPTEVVLAKMVLRVSFMRHSLASLKEPHGLQKLL
jgi:hypothetical protein